MNSATTDSTQPRQSLVDDLIAGNYLRSAHWKRAFRSERRENYLDRFAVPNPRGDDHWYDLTDPAARASALAAVYSNTSLVTHYDTAGAAISSSSQPSLMALMLEHLDADPGERPRVLEIGLGTGYNAGLLCRALGDEQIVTLDVDPGITRPAGEALRRAGHRPQLVTGDGDQGAPGYGPFDRILATCGFDRVPADWTDQLAPQAVVVLNLGLALARLRSTKDGGLCGPLVDYAGFMPRRPTPETVAPSVRALSALAGGDGEQTRRIPTLSTLDAPQFRALRSVVFPTVRQIGPIPADGSWRWIDSASHAWSRLTPIDDKDAELCENGRSVYTDITELHTEWQDHGRPEITRYGLTVWGDGTHLLWLDTPDRLVRVLT